MQFYVNGDQFCARAGTTVYIPKNTTHNQFEISIQNHLIFTIRYWKLSRRSYHNLWYATN